MAKGQSKITDEPKIHTSLNLSENPSTKHNKNNNTNNNKKGKAKSRPDKSDERGDLLVGEFWDNCTDTIFDIRVTNLDGETNKDKALETVLKQHEKEKKDMYLQACIKQRRHFSPFVVSTDGVFAEEAKRVLQRLAAILAKKWGKPYSQVYSFVKTRMSIAVARATHLCLRGSRVPIKLISPRNPHWEDGTGFIVW
jgi:hypothetical protein